MAGQAAYTPRGITSTALCALVLAMPITGTWSMSPRPTETPSAAVGGVIRASIVRSALVPSHGALWGSWVAPVGGQSDTQAIAAFEATVQRRLDIVHQYHAWDDAWPTAAENDWASEGRIIFGNASARQGSSAVLTWTAIASGSQDSVIHALAARLRAFGHSIFFSFDEEPEQRYHANPTTYSLASYVAAYRHIHDLFVADGATNVVWVWNVSGYSADEPIYQSLYPGDAYVDWVGWDPYNWFNCPVNTTNVWQSFDTVVAPFYDWLSAGMLSPGSATKPYMLAEYGTVENAGSPTKGQWFTGEASSLPSRPLIKAIVYFNENKECNWPVTTSRGSVDGFTAAGQDCYVNRALPSPPASVSASAGDAAATVRWTNATSVCPVINYTIIASPGGTRISVPGGVQSTSVDRLSNGISYVFQVTATSLNGTSDLSPASAAVTPTNSRLSASPSQSIHPGAASPQNASPTLGAPSTRPTIIGKAANKGENWLLAHAYVPPITVIVLVGLGLGLRRWTTRRR